MILTFRKTAQRRYAVDVYRDSHPDLEMDPAPGYDPLVPHDLLHLVVEAALGLSNGIFGQLAAGGDAGTFRIRNEAGTSNREAARRRRRQHKRGIQLAKKGESDSAQSERAAYVGWHAWLMRSTVTKRQALGQSRAEQARQVRGCMTPEEQQAFDDSLDKICRHLDELSATWVRLAVGESMSVQWPELRLVDEARRVPA